MKSNWQSRVRARLGVVLPFLLALHLPTAVSGQQQTSCSDCRIEVQELASLTEAAGVPSPHPQWPITVTEWRDGYLIAPSRNFSSIISYGASGVPQGTLTPPDTGFAWVGEVKATADGLVIVDRILRSLHRLTRDGEYSLVPLGYGPEGVISLPGGRFATQAQLDSEELIGLPIHIHEPNGRHIRSFGQSELPIRTGAPYDGRRHISPGPNGTILAGFINRYRIELWNERGELLWAIEKERPWFAERWRSVPSNPESERPPAWFESVRLDETGLLWCVFHVADAQWAKSQTEGRGMTEDGALRRSEKHRVYDTIIEVINHQTGDLVAAARFDSVISGYLNSGGNLYTSDVPDGEGSSTLQILRLSLSRGEQRR